MATSSTPSSDSAKTPRLRLRTFTRPDPRHQFVDGGWWPRSRNLTDELPAMLVEASREGFETYRVTYDLDAWAATARRMVISGRSVKVGGFHTQRAAETVALSDASGAKRLVLMVIPPDTDAATAEEALAQSGNDNGMESADTILATASTSTSVTSNTVTDQDGD